MASAGRELLPGLEIVWILGGSFTMGSADPVPVVETDGPRIRPRTPATVDGFFCAVLPLTHGVLARLGYQGSGTRPPDQVVSGLGWWDAAEACNRLSGLLQLEPAVEVPVDRDAGRVDVRLGAPGARMPGELEWERACGGDEEGASPRSRDDAAGPVASLRTSDLGVANCFGVRGMLRGVLEWTVDWADAYPDEFLPTDIGLVPRDDAEARVARGSPWNAPLARVSYVRHFVAPDATRHLGLRIVFGRALASTSLGQRLDLEGLIAATEARRRVPAPRPSGEGHVGAEDLEDPVANAGSEDGEDQDERTGFEDGSEPDELETASESWHDETDDTPRGADDESIGGDNVDEPPLHVARVRDVLLKRCAAPDVVDRLAHLRGLVDLDPAQLLATDAAAPWRAQWVRFAEEVRACTTMRRVTVGGLELLEAKADDLVRELDELWTTLRHGPLGSALESVPSWLPWRLDARDRSVHAVVLVLGGPGPEPSPGAVWRVEGDLRIRLGRRLDEAWASIAPRLGLIRVLRDDGLVAFDERPGQDVLVRLAGSGRALQDVEALLHEVAEAPELPAADLLDLWPKPDVSLDEPLRDVARVEEGLRQLNELRHLAGRLAWARTQRIEAARLRAEAEAALGGATTEASSPPFSAASLVAEVATAGALARAARATRELAEDVPWHEALTTSTLCSRSWLDAAGAHLAAEALRWDIEVAEVRRGACQVLEATGGLGDGTDLVDASLRDARGRLTRLVDVAPAVAEDASDAAPSSMTSEAREVLRALAGLRARADRLRAWRCDVAAVGDEVARRWGEILDELAAACPAHPDPAALRRAIGRRLRTEGEAGRASERSRLRALAVALEPAEIEGGVDALPAWRELLVTGDGPGRVEVATLLDALDMLLEACQPDPTLLVPYLDGVRRVASTAFRHWEIGGRLALPPLTLLACEWRHPKDLR